MIGQMQFITPEENRPERDFEIQAGNTATTSSPRWIRRRWADLPRRRDAPLRAGRNARARAQARGAGVAFEMLGRPSSPRSSGKPRSCACWSAPSTRSPRPTPRRWPPRPSSWWSPTPCCARASSRSASRSCLADGKRLLRGPEIKCPFFHGRKDLEITDALIEKWATRAGSTCASRTSSAGASAPRAIQKEVTAIPFNDTSSRYDRDHEFWFGDGEINVGRVAG